MADMRISDLPQASSINGEQQFEVNDAGVSRHVTLQQIYDHIQTLLAQVYALAQHTHPASDIVGGAPSGSGGDLDINLDTVGQLPYSRLSGAPGVTSIGLQLMMATSAEQARQIIGASGLTLGYGANQAKPGNWTPHIHNNTVGTLPISRTDYTPPWSPGNGADP